MALGDNCSTACVTRDHETLGACLRSKNLQLDVAVPGTGYDPATSKAWDSELDLYRSARRQGVQPSSTKRPAIERALRISEETGTAFQA